MTERMLVGNAADPKQVKRAKQLLRHRQERERADLQSVASSVQGRRVLWKWLCESAVFQQSFVPGQMDLTAFNEGRRRLGLGLMLDLAEIDVTLYHRMAKEAQALDEADTQSTTDSRQPKAETDSPNTEETDDATD